MRKTDFIHGLMIISRSRVVPIAGLMILFMLTVSISSAQFSGRQPATIALDSGISILRFGLPLLVILLVQELISNEFDRKLYLISTTYPRSRRSFLLGRTAAIAVPLSVILIVATALLAALAAWFGHGYGQITPPDLGPPYLVTIAFIALDLLVVLAIGTLIAVTTTTPSFVLIGTLGFMLVARSYSAIVALLTRDTTLVGNADTYQSSLGLLGYLLPDLGTLDVRMISLYGDWQFLPDDWPLRVVSTLAYAAALFALSVWALNRKKFS